MAQRGHRTDRAVQAAELVADRSRGLDRHPVDRTVHRHPAGNRLCNRIVTGAVRIRTELAPPGDRDINDIRLDLAYRFLADAPTLHGAGLEVFDHDVRLGGELEEDVARLGKFEIETQAALVAIDGSVDRAELGAGEEWRHVPGYLALGHFNFDHVDAQISQHSRVQRPRRGGGRFEYAYSGHRPRNISSRLAVEFGLFHNIYKATK